MSNSVEFKHISFHDVPEQSPGFLLWQISTAWRASVESVLKPLGLTHPQFVVLATVGWLTRNGGRVTQSAVGKMAGLDPNTLSQVLRGLEFKKLIERIPSSDVRAKNPLLTVHGSQMLVSALPAVERADAHFFSILSVQQAEMALGIFKKLATQGRS